MGLALKPTFRLEQHIVVHAPELRAEEEHLVLRTVDVSGDGTGYGTRLTGGIAPLFRLRELWDAYAELAEAYRRAVRSARFSGGFDPGDADADLDYLDNLTHGTRTVQLASGSPEVSLDGR